MEYSKYSITLHTAGKKATPSFDSHNIILIPLSFCLLWFLNTAQTVYVFGAFTRNIHPGKRNNIEIQSNTSERVRDLRNHTELPTRAILNISPGDELLMAYAPGSLSFPDFDSFNIVPPSSSKKTTPGSAALRRVLEVPEHDARCSHERDFSPLQEEDE